MVSSFKHKNDIKNNREMHFSQMSVNTFAMFVIATITIFVYIVISLEAEKWENSVLEHKNLLLTPFVNAGNITEARERAKVNLFPGVESYSGFLTVDEACKSHIFFWFFPASSGNVSAPLILWHGGGPGTSGMFALFQGTGPVLLDQNGKFWKENFHSWAKYRSVLYFDNPVGTGFSYSEFGENCYAASNDDVAESAVLALRQFFQLFPEYQTSSFYIATSSYGGKFVPAIAARIVNDNELDKIDGNPDLTSINLKGVLSISGFSDPIHQIDYGQFYYNMGIINESQLKYFQSQETLAKAYIRSKKFYEAYKIIEPLVIGNRDGPSYLKNVTGISHPYNFVEDLRNETPNNPMFLHDVFLNQPWVQEAIHVDTNEIGRKFSTTNEAVYVNLARDLYKSVADLVENLLNAEIYFLFTAGQLDLIVPHTTVSKFVHSLKWDKAKLFNSVKPIAWQLTKGDKVIGYGERVYNLAYLMLRNVGHHPFLEEPEWTEDILLNFAV